MRNRCPNYCCSPCEGGGFMDDLRNSDWFKNLLTPPEDWNGNTIIVDKSDKEKLSAYMYP